MTFPYNTTTLSPEQTESVGRTLSELLLSDPSLPRFVAMYGDLGVGKTAFVRGFSAPIAPSASVKSPTFAIVNQYGRTLYHFDMYRITDEEDLYSIGFYDYIAENNFCIIEWSENIPYALPSEYLKVVIEKNSDIDTNSRAISITYEK